MTTNYLLVVLSVYGIIATAGFLAYWLTRRWQTSKPLLVIVGIAALATGIAWEAFSVVLNLLTIGQISLHAYGWGSFGYYVLFPLTRIGFTAILGLPAALAVAAIFRRRGFANRDHLV